MRSGPILQRLRRLTTAAVTTALLATVVAIPVQAGGNIPKADNGECRVYTGAPFVDEDLAVLAFVGKAACVHASVLRQVDAQIQLWRAAGVPGRKGDILLSDTGWQSWPFPHNQSVTRVSAKDAPCAAKPKSMTAYVRVRVRSAAFRVVPGF